MRIEVEGVFEPLTNLLSLMILTTSVSELELTRSRRSPVSTNGSIGPITPMTSVSDFGVYIVTSTSAKILTSNMVFLRVSEILVTSTAIKFRLEFTLTFFFSRLQNGSSLRDFASFIGFLQNPGLDSLSMALMIKVRPGVEFRVWFPEV